MEQIKQIRMDTLKNRNRETQTFETKEIKKTNKKDLVIN
jgi:hypothetical protein